MKQFDSNEDGAKIAREMGITRQAVSNTLKRAMKKVYNETRRINPELTPFSAAAMMLKMFEVDEANEVNKFFHLFPPYIREEIKQDIIESRRKRVQPNENTM
jgi:predicted DNA-binding protein YlxM (UPF0122 family)